MSTATNITWHDGQVSREDRQKLLQQKGVTLWLTGLSAAGKSTIACLLEKLLLEKGRHAYRLDGDNIRHGLNKNLGFTEVDRVEGREAAEPVLVHHAPVLVIVRRTPRQVREVE